ncbi:hypothetical protein FS837_009237 [Tulasnella sp. UAMH 9824]|nr:hypothetical protein FS837_009237 [Tulasnella sp. UAMH 9824]
MSSRTITPSPTASPTYTTSLVAPVTTTTDLFDIPTEDPMGGSKSAQSYIYPTAAFAVALVVAVQVCRLLERRRLRRRHAMGLALRANGDDEDEDAAFAKLPPPVMHTVYLDKKSWAEHLRTPRWEGIMPLSSNLVVRPEETSLAGDAEPESGPHAIGFYDRFAAEQRRLEAARKQAEEAGEEEVVDPRLPRDLVAGIMIAMPSRSKPRHEQQKPESEFEEDDERLPDVAIGVLEKRWQAGVD